MSEPLTGVVVCHRDLAAALIGAAEEIAGVRGALVPVSNTGCDRGQLEERVRDAISGRPAVVFVDMPSGSCLLATLHRLRGAPDVAVVTGVNLAMLLDFLFHRELGPAEAAERAVQTGSRAIRIPA
jgi:mannose/fructose-specific phosphotransferase system component IIA